MERVELLTVSLKIINYITHNLTMNQFNFTHKENTGKSHDHNQALTSSKSI
jgi:hypothetical protein